MLPCDARVVRRGWRPGEFSRRNRLDWRSGAPQSLSERARGQLDASREIIVKVLIHLPRRSALSRSCASTKLCGSAPEGRAVKQACGSEHSPGSQLAPEKAAPIDSRDHSSARSCRLPNAPLARTARSMWCLLVSDTPSGHQRVRWAALPSTAQGRRGHQVLAVVDAYRARWRIEECAGALHPHRVELVAPPSAVEARATRLVSFAKLGGHLKRNGDPGWITLGRGYERLLTLEQGWKLARPGNSRRRYDQS